MRHIIFFTKGDATTPSSHQRVWLVAEHLKRAYGHDYDIIYNIGHSLWMPSLKRLRVLKHMFWKLRAKSGTFMYVHKSLYPWDVIALILFAKWRGRKKLIYDLDDAEWIHSPHKTRMLARAADVVVAGSHYIADYIKQINKNVVFIPTVFDIPSPSYIVEHGRRDRFTIGWVGTGKGHFLDGHFHIIRPALDMLARDDIPFRFLIIGSQHYQPLKDYFTNALFETIFIGDLDWQNTDSVPRTLHEYQCDVGLMPTADTAFNRAKCGGKAIEYMRCGIPVVASPVGENEVVVGEGGFFARTDKEWLETIKTLLADEALRKEMGKKAKERMQQHYSYQAVLPAYQRLFTTL